MGKSTNNIFGLPYSCKESDIIVLPVPWEVTVSSKIGTAQGPSAIFDASFQVDLYDPDFPDLWKSGIAMKDIPYNLIEKNNALRHKVNEYIQLLQEDNNITENKLAQTLCSQINESCILLNNWVKNESLELLNQDKLIAVIGGDHSIALGYMHALSEKYDDFGILQIDAHMDLRKAYEGFEFSHASIMYNALNIKQISKIVQIGIRDYCEEEVALVNKMNDRIMVFPDKEIKQHLFEGKPWQNICSDIISELPDTIYISFDIDGLNPSLCPNTGTPVPGGFQFEEITYLIGSLVKNGKKIIGFDLCEVARGNKTTSSGWDENVGARMLLKLCGWMAKSNKKISNI